MDRGDCRAVQLLIDVLDAQQFGKELNGHGRDTGRCILGHSWPLSLGKASFEIETSFRYQGQPLKQKMLVGPDLLHDLDDKENCEYLLAVKWIKSVPQEKAKFRRNAALFTTQQIAASIANQPITLEFLESEFKVDFQKLLSAA